MRLARPLRALLLAAVLGPALLSVPTGVQQVTRAVGPLPDCRLDDIYTEPRGYDDWATTQVDWILSLGPGYKPPDLVSVRDGGVGGGGLIRAVTIDDLKAMAAAASANGTPLVAWSPYRSYREQVSLFNGYAGWNKKTKQYSNFKNAVTFSARPGHSEHQTGLTIDFVAVGDHGLTSNWEVTPTGSWMAENAWKYGWLMSYPKGKQDVVCYSYEPWHYRYVGRDIAKEIHDAGTTIREYLWGNYTQLDPACIAAAPPKLRTPGSPRSCALPDANPSGGPPTPGASKAARSPGPSATGAFSGGNDGSGVPTTPPAASPATALEQALPLGIAVVLALLLLITFASWRSSRRRRAAPPITRR